MAKKRQMKTMGGPVWYRSWKTSKKGEGGWDEGDMVGGVIVDTSIDKKYNRKNYHIKVETKNFECENQHGQPLEEGCVLILNGCGILEKHLADVKRGDYIEVEFLEAEAEIMSGDWEGETAISLKVSIEDAGSPLASSDNDGDEGEENLL